MYIIWTEYKNTIDVMEKLAELFDGYNVMHVQGRYNGKGESWRIEIFNDGEPLFAVRVFKFARWIAEHNELESVSLLRQDDPHLVFPRVGRIVRNEFGIERLDEPEGVYDIKGDRQ